MRVFLALELPVEIKQGLAKVRRQLKSSSANVRWEKPEKLHITLVFMGAVPEERVGALKGIVSEGLEGIGQIKLGLGGFGVFPNEQRPRVVWVGLRGEVETLSRLQQQLTQALSEAGFSFDRKKFHPHVTIGRVPRQKRSAYLGGRGDSDLAETLREVGVGELGEAEFTVGAVMIMESVLQPTGSVYTPLARIPLGP